MSFDKRKDFQEAADKAEQEFYAQYPKGEPDPAPVADEVPTPQEKMPEPTEVAPPSPVEEDKYKAAVKAMNEAQRKAADAAKREEDFARREAELREQLDQALENARLAMQRVTPRVDAQEEHDDLEDDMPEVAKLAKRMAARELSPLQKRLDDMEARQKAEEANRERISKDTLAKKMLADIKEAHPDYEELVNSEAMQNWVNTEAPPIYKQIFDGTIPYETRDAVAVLNAYKSTTTPKKVSSPETPSAAEVAAPVRTNPNISPKLTPDRELTAKDYDYFMHNSHRMKPDELAEWDRRLNS